MSIKFNKVFITGVAGFIGSFVSRKFLENGFKVLGIDNLNDYYDVDLKKKRLNFVLEGLKNHNYLWEFHDLAIQDKDKLFKLFEKFQPEIVINLAAQAGVRYSIINPFSYAESNIIGFLNILEACKKYKIKHLVFASSSSVYGSNLSQPFKESDFVDQPISFYAATKKSNEVMAYSYSHLYKLPTTGMRFFTVYGPWGRPDMAPMIFVDSILKDKPIDIFNFGKMDRDFTYIDDVVEAVFKCALKIPNEKKLKDSKHNEFSIIKPPYEIFNVGYGKPVSLLKFIEILENNLQKKAIKNFLPMQQGDVKSTYSDINKLRKWIDYHPKVDIKQGIERFIKWYLEIYS